MNARQAGLLEILSANARGIDRLLGAERLARVEIGVHHEEEMPAHLEALEVIGIETSRRLQVPRLPAAMVMVSFREHRQRDPPAAVTLRQPFLLPQGPQAQHRLHLLQVLEEAILHSAHRQDRAAAVVAASHTTLHATFLAHHVAVHGALVHEEAVASVAASTMALPLVLVVPSVVLHLIQLLSVAPAIRLQLHTPARCASVTI